MKAVTPKFASRAEGARVVAEVRRQLATGWGRQRPKTYVSA